MIRGKHLIDLVRTFNAVVGVIRSWIAGKGLKHVDHKTAVLLVNSRKSMEFVIITVTSITSKQAIKHLGVVIDNRHMF